MRPLLLLVLAGSLAVFPAASAVGSGGLPPGTILGLTAQVPVGLILLRPDGKFIQRVRTANFSSTVGLDLAPNRRFAFLGDRLREPGTGVLWKILIPGGEFRRVDDGISPAISPDGASVAYLHVIRRNEIAYADALVVQTLRSGARKVIPLGTTHPLGTPPEEIINWSPNGRMIALVRRCCGLRERAGTSIVSLRGVAPPKTNFPGVLAPAFLDDRTLVGLVNCCIGRQQLDTIDLRSGRREPFATLASPPEAVRVRAGRRLLVTTALHTLLVMDNHSTERLRAGIAVASD